MSVLSTNTGIQGGQDGFFSGFEGVVERAESKISAHASSSLTAASLKVKKGNIGGNTGGTSPSGTGKGTNAASTTTTAATTATTATTTVQQQERAPVSWDMIPVPYMDVAPSLELSVHVRTPSPFLPLVVGAKNQISMNEGVEEELIMRSILESNETTLELGGHVGKRIVVRLMRDEDATCSFKVQSVRLSLRGTRIPGEGVSPTVSPTVYPTVYPTNVLLRKRLYMTVCSITNQGSEQLRCHAMKILNCGMNDNNINEELNWGEFVLTNMLLTCVVQAKHSTTVDTTIALLHTMSNCNVSHDEQEEAEETNNTLPFGARLVNHVLRLLSTIHQTSASPCAITGVFKLVRMFWNFAPKACAQATVRYAVHLSEQNVTMTSQRYGFCGCGCNSVFFVVVGLTTLWQALI